MLEGYDLLFGDERLREGRESKRSESETESNTVNKVTGRVNEKD